MNVSETIVIVAVGGLVAGVVVVVLARAFRKIRRAKAIIVAAGSSKSGSYRNSISISSSNTSTVTK